MNIDPKDQRRLGARYPRGHEILDAIQAISSSQIVVDIIEQENSLFERRYIVKILQELAEADYGVFKSGRKGKPSRLELKEVFTSEQSAVEPISSAAVDDKAVMIPYVFNLREGCTVTIPLPNDLTADEVERLSAFLKTLPA